MGLSWGDTRQYWFHPGWFMAYGDITALIMGYHGDVVRDKTNHGGIEWNLLELIGGFLK